MTMARSRLTDAPALALTPSASPELIGQSPVMRRLQERIERFAATPLPILLTGETGTGKEVVAQSIARRSGMCRTFIPVNCAALPPSLIESELFGHEQGAFTGAVRRHEGIVARADGGVLFLDEIGELSLSTQAKFLRALEIGEYTLVGGTQVRHSRFRLIAATNRDLGTLAERGEFRRDLLHRLGVVRLVLPPLRDRLEDLPALTEHFLAQFRHEFAGGPARFSEAALQLCRSYPWPGNVRELKHVVHAAAAVTSGPTVDAEMLAEFLDPEARVDTGAVAELRTLAEQMRQAEVAAIHAALRRASGDRVRAAALLGISVSTLYRRLGTGGDLPVAESSARDPAR
jgi:DNA-binding NtrC family response regulator